MRLCKFVCNEERKLLCILYYGSLIALSQHIEPNLMNRDEDMKPCHATERSILLFIRSEYIVINKNCTPLFFTTLVTAMGADLLLINT